MPLAALTAWQALHELGGLASSQRVLINGASGGVGTFAIKFARVAGAEVTGVCSQVNADLVRCLRASEAIDYKAQDPTDATGFDLVFDAVTELPFAVSKQMLTWRRVGQHALRRLVPCRPAAGPLPGGGGGGGKVRLATVKPKGHQLEQVGALMLEGKVEAVVERSFHITEIAAAHAESASGRVRGKIAIAMFLRTPRSF